MDDLIFGDTTVEKAKLFKVEAAEIFEDAAFELHKWHSNEPTGYTGVQPIRRRTRGHTFAKQQLRQSQNGNCSLLGLA